MSEQFSHLQTVEEVQQAAPSAFPNLRPGGGNGYRATGIFALPPEFDQKTLKGGFFEEGNEAAQMEADQPVIGTHFTHQGWKVWKFPDIIPGSEKEEDGKKSKGERHPKAGQPYKVRTSGKDGKTYVCMYLPLAVSSEVERAYAQISREKLQDSIDGDNLVVNNDEQGATAEIVDPGMLGAKQLPNERGVDRNVVIHSSTRRVSASKRITAKPEITLSR